MMEKEEKAELNGCHGGKEQEGNEGEKKMGEKNNRTEEIWLSWQHKQPADQRRTGAVAGGCQTKQVYFSEPEQKNENG